MVVDCRKGDRHYRGWLAECRKGGYQCKGLLIDQEESKDVELLIRKGIMIKKNVRKSMCRKMIDFLLVMRNVLHTP